MASNGKAVDKGSDKGDILRLELPEYSNIFHALGRVIVIGVVPNLQSLFPAIGY
jgi:hypothetical protein